MENTVSDSPSLYSHNYTTENVHFDLSGNSDSVESKTCLQTFEAQIISDPQVFIDRKLCCNLTFSPALAIDM